MLGGYVECNISISKLEQCLLFIILVQFYSQLSCYRNALSQIYVIVIEQIY